VKRNVALISLSREHHKALSVARQLRRVTPESADAVREATPGFWLQHEAAHFRAEEKLLLSAYAKHGVRAIRSSPPCCAITWIFAGA